MPPSRIAALWLPSCAQTQRGGSIWAAAGQSGSSLKAASLLPPRLLASCTM
ncbi:Hypothetical predicted protein [Scomber scombrus]|uniref:Uncharacterized protein n=1 Tax=Scomber scombrus TaxID=13677 RepID=A0AAV1NGV5_SCOSC